MDNLHVLQAGEGLNREEVCQAWGEACVGDDAQPSTSSPSVVSLELPQDILADAEVAVVRPQGERSAQQRISRASADSVDDSRTASERSSQLLWTAKVHPGELHLAASRAPNAPEAALPILIHEDNLIGRAAPRECVGDRRADPARSDDRDACHPLSSEGGLGNGAAPSEPCGAPWPLFLSHPSF